MAEHENKTAGNCYENERSSFDRVGVRVIVGIICACGAVKFNFVEIIW